MDGVHFELQVKSKKVDVREVVRGHTFTICLCKAEVGWSGFKRTLWHFLQNFVLNILIHKLIMKIYSSLSRRREGAIVRG